VSNINYDQLANRYYWREKSLETVSKLVNPQPDDIILDLDCGTGEQIINLADDIKLGIGIDLSEGMIKQAKEKAEQNQSANLEFYVGTFAEPDQTIDLKGKEVTKVISNYALHHLSLPEKQEAIKKMITAVGKSLEEIYIGDLMFFDEPSKYKDGSSEVGYGPEVDQPSKAEELKACFAETDFNVELHKLHPLVGVLAAKRDI